MACTAACGSAIPDRDRDGLDDRLEARLAGQFLPALHEFRDATGSDACPWPERRPILFRARPVAGDVDRIAITYVLIYAQDCGALGHTGDNESFTIFVTRRGDRWQRIGVSAVAHLGTEAERRTTGPGQDIWISRNKHSPYASFEVCAADDWIVSQCARDGPKPAAATLFNAGEPGAPMSNDLGDLMVAAGADPARARGLAPWAGSAIDAEGEARLVTALSTARPADDQIDLMYLLVRGRPIWTHAKFLGAGDIAAELTDKTEWPK